MAAINSEDGEERDAAMQKYNDLYLSRSDFMKEQATGFVWLYLQK